jgi:hypothetical protein
VIASFTTRIARPSAAMLIGAILLFITGMSGQKGLSYMYYPYAQEAYKLGLALRQMTQSNDLVVTMANAIGAPNVIYYSQRRGWTFPLCNIATGHYFDSRNAF